jgi:hypothetical protein
MIRTLIVPDQQNINIRIPESFVGKTVEIIAFEINETEDPSKAVPKSFDEILKFYRSVNLDLSEYKFDRDEANER